MKRSVLFLAVTTLAVSALAQPKHVIAGIEIGGSGIKALTLEVTEQADGYVVNELFKRQINAQLAGGMKGEVIQDDRIKKAAAAAAELKDELKKYDPEYVFVAASTAFEQAQNKDVLTEAVKKATFQAPDFITTDDEVRYGMLANIPKARLDYSVLVDIGGRNSKVGYVTKLARNGFEAVSFPYGSRSLEDAAKGGDGALQRILEADVAPAVKDATSDRPGLTNPLRPIYIIGGAAWAAATLAKPNEIGQPSVKLTLPELKTLYSKLPPEGKNLIDVGLVPERLSPAATAMIRRVQDAFPDRRLRPAIGLLVTILDNMGAGQSRQIIFPASTAEGGWLYGYMFGKYNEAKTAAEKSKK